MNNFHYNKDYGLIKLKTLADYYNRVLGSAYHVELNSLEVPLDDNNITVVSLQATRSPFAINNVKAETMSVSLSFRVKLEPTECKERIIDDMKMLIGCQRYQVDEIQGEETKTYNITSYLDMQQPLGSPQHDCGYLYADYLITGTLLVSDSTAGAVMSNDIITEISQDIESEQPIYVPLAVISSQLKSTLQTENILKNDSDKIYPTQIAHGKQLTIQALYLNGVNDSIILAIEQGTLKKCKIRKEYPSFVVTTDYAVIDTDIVEKAGAYMQFTLTLQEKE